MHDLPNCFLLTRYWRNSWSVKFCTSVNNFDKTCLLMTRKKTIVIFSRKNKLHFFSSIDVLYIDGTFKSALKFLHQQFTIHGFTICNLNFSYRSINFRSPMSLWGCNQADGIRGYKTWCECFFSYCFADFETAIHNAVTTVWPGLELKHVVSIEDRAG